MKSTPARRDAAFKRANAPGLKSARGKKRTEDREGSAVGVDSRVKKKKNRANGLGQREKERAEKVVTKRVYTCGGWSIYIVGAGLV